MTAEGLGRGMVAAVSRGQWGNRPVVPDSLRGDDMKSHQLTRRTET